MKIPLTLLLLTAGEGHAQVKDYQGRDKGQHLQFGFASTSLCAAALSAPKGCFIASEVGALGQQLYALKTNPTKRGREAAYDLLAHTIGASVATGGYWYLTRDDHTTKLNFTKAF